MPFRPIELQETSPMTGGFRPLTIEKPQVEQPKSFGQKVLDAGTAVTNFLGGKAVQETFGAELAKLGATPEEKKYIEQPTLAETTGSALQLGATFLPVGGIGSAITKGVGKLGLKTGASAIGKVASGAIAGEVFDVGQNLQEGKTGVEALTPGIGTAVGAAIPALGVATNVAKRALPKLLSYTSDVPEKAFETMLARREPVTQAIKAGASPEKALKNTQDAVRGLRKTLTSEWQESVTNIADEFKGKRLGLSDKSLNKLENLADDFGFSLPQNPKSASAQEWIDTLKSINEVPKLALTVSPKGAGLRKAKEDLSKSVIQAFGGDKGSVATLYKNYAVKKGVFDAANDIVKAYSTGKPIQQTTALNRLQALFDENKPAYLQAIIDLEKTTGRDLLSEITASKFAKKMPTTRGITQGSVFDKAIKLLLAPLSSPRSAGFINRVVGDKPIGGLKGFGDNLSK